MSRAKTNKRIKRIVDAAMTVLLLCLMAYQVTGEMAHEWIGMGMTALAVVHQLLNRKWYGALFKGRYNPYRTVTTILNVLLLLSFALTAFCGMSMSGYAVPFLYGMAPVFFVRRTHLSMSHWAFVLMGLHLGMHIPALTGGLRLKENAKAALFCIFTCIGGIGLWLFLRNGMQNYLFFRVPFAFLDYDKAGWLVFLENLLMLSFWAFVGSQAARICRNAAGKTQRNPLIPVVAVLAAVVLGVVLTLLFPSADGAASFGDPDWSQPQAEAPHAEEPAETQDPAPEAQEDQHRQARPELSDHVQNMDEYDIILLGYPNWWASIPMPIASFLEEYDFSGKTIIPFCSHGGGRFGQSLTAIAKLAPDAALGEGLSVHYSGGATLPEDVTAWLETNGVRGN